MALRIVTVGLCLCALLLMLMGCTKKTTAPGPAKPGISGTPGAAPASNNAAPDASTVAPPPPGVDEGGAEAPAASPASPTPAAKVEGEGKASTKGSPAPPPYVQKAINEGKKPEDVALPIGKK